MQDISSLGFRYRALFPIPLVIVALIFAKPSIYSLILGSVLVLMGVILRVICLGYLGVKSRDEVPNIANLITAGPYRYTRNPVYIANIIIATGITIFSFGGYGILVSIISALIVIFVYFLFYNYLVIPAEERFLEEKFKEDYLEYKKVVPRWLINFKQIPTRGRFRTLPIWRTEYWTWILIIMIYLIILVRAKILKI